MASISFLQKVLPPTNAKKRKSISCSAIVRSSVAPIEARPELSRDVSHGNAIIMAFPSFQIPLYYLNKVISQFKRVDIKNAILALDRRAAYSQRVRKRFRFVR
jgi:hypothetical protein